MTLNKYYCWRMNKLQARARARQRRFLNPTNWFSYLTKREKKLYLRYSLKIDEDKL